MTGGLNNQAMTADKQQSPRSPTGSFSQSYANAFVYPGAASPKSVQQSPGKHPHGPRTQSGDSSSDYPSMPPQSPLKAVDPRDRPGSSRTRVTQPLPSVPTAPDMNVQSDSRARTEVEALVNRPQTPETSSQETAVAPYRSPEPVYDPPEDNPPGYVPGVIEGHFGGSDDGIQMQTPPAAGSSPVADGKFDVSQWQANVGQDDGYQEVDNQQPERPQIGPGMMPRCVEEKIHDHPAHRITNLRIPEYTSRKTHGMQPSTSNLLSPKLAPADSNASPATKDQSSLPAIQPQPTGGSLHLEHVRSLKDVQNSLPGESEGYMDWYFCWRCSGWFKVLMGAASIEDGHLRGSDLEWDIKTENNSPGASPNFDAIRGRGFLRDIEHSRMTPSGETHVHFHEIFSSSVEPIAHTLERVDQGLEVDSFPHKGLESEIKPEWYERVASVMVARLFLCCTTSASIYVGPGPVPGQIPSALLRAFITEKMGDLGPVAPGDKGPEELVIDAIQLLITSVRFPSFMFSS